ncbi:MAG: hypothetical protein HS114_28990 [Anaerolineales bacterium]|nr:hypothetical protein [Anaerolineales bacterium]
MTTANLWSEVLKLLQHQMTKATFQTWLENTSAEEVEGRLIVATPSSFGQDWLDNRLRSTVELAVETVFGRKIPVEFRVAENSGYQPELFFTGTYRDAYNAIVQPDKQHYCSRYFHQQWLPLLGPELWLLIWEMRTRCSWDWKTGEIRRDVVEATAPELAAAIGVSESTFWRLLKHEHAAKFITRIGTKRRYSKTQSGTVNEKNIWRVRLDDPLTPADEEMLKRQVSPCQNDR